MSNPIRIDCLGEEESHHHVGTITGELVGCLHECHASCDDVIYEDDVFASNVACLDVEVLCRVCLLACDVA